MWDESLGSGFYLDILINCTCFEHAFTTPIHFRQNEGKVHFSREISDWLSDIMKEEKTSCRSGDQIVTEQSIVLVSCSSLS